MNCVNIDWYELVLGHSILNWNGMGFFSWNLLPTNWYFDLQCNFIVKIVKKKTRINSEVYEHEKYERSHFWC